MNLFFRRLLSCSLLVIAIWLICEAIDSQKLYNTFQINEDIGFDEENNRHVKGRIPKSPLQSSLLPQTTTTTTTTTAQCIDLEATTELARELSQTTVIVSLAAYESPAHILLLVRNALASAATQRALIVIHLNRATYQQQQQQQQLYVNDKEMNNVAASDDDWPTHYVELGATSGSNRTSWSLHGDAHWLALCALHAQRRVLLNTRHRVSVSRGSMTLLYGHVMNVRLVRRLAPHIDSSTPVVLQASNMVWIRRGWDVYAQRAHCSLPYDTRMRHVWEYTGGFKCNMDRHFAALFNDKQNASVTHAYQMRHEGSFYPLRTVEAFTAWLEQIGMFNESAGNGVAREFDIGGTYNCGSEERYLPSWLLNVANASAHWRECIGFPMCFLGAREPIVPASIESLRAIYIRNNGDALGSPIYAYKWIERTRQPSVYTQWLANLHTSPLPCKTFDGTTESLCYDNNNNNNNNNNTITAQSLSTLIDPLSNRQTSGVFALFHTLKANKDLTWIEFHKQFRNLDFLGIVPIQEELNWTISIDIQMKMIEKWKSSENKIR